MVSGTNYLAVTFEDDEDIEEEDCLDQRVKLRSYRLAPTRAATADPGSEVDPYVLLEERPFAPGTSWHTYRIEAVGNTARLLIDGDVVLEGTDNQFVSSDIVALFSRNVELNVRSLRIIAM